MVIESGIATETRGTAGAKEVDKSGTSACKPVLPAAAVAGEYFLSRGAMPSNDSEQARCRRNPITPCGRPIDGG